MKKNVEIKCPNCKHFFEHKKRANYTCPNCKVSFGHWTQEIEYPDEEFYRESNYDGTWDNIIKIIENVESVENKRRLK